MQFGTLVLICNGVKVTGRMQEALKDLYWPVLNCTAQSFIVNGEKEDTHFYFYFFSGVWAAEIVIYPSTRKAKNVFEPRTSY